jgi:uncharacterized membrane protein SpoIIM required for sporulation
MGVTQYKIICLTLLIVSIALGYLVSSGGNLMFNKTSFSNIEGHVLNFELFFLILRRNLIVGFVLACIGYFTGGIITFLVLIWNGVVLGAILSAVKITIPIVIQYFLIHGCIEVYAFMCFGAIGLKGFNFYKKILNNGTIDYDLNLSKLIMPSSLLVVSGLVETYLISYL